jgi:hypothetical protein
VFITGATFTDLPQSARDLVLRVMTGLAPLMLIDR